MLASVCNLVLDGTQHASRMVKGWSNGIKTYRMKNQHGSHQARGCELMDTRTELRRLQKVQCQSQE